MYAEQCSVKADPPIPPTHNVSHPDDPVFSFPVTHEEDAGQMADCYPTSLEFGCDGNCYTSITYNSSE